MIECVVYQRVKKTAIPESTILVAAKKVCSRIGKKEVQLSIHLIGDDRMRTLNRLHRGKDSTTDVLSFPLVEYEGVDGFVSPVMMEGGDIFISVKQIERQAKEFHISYKEEFMRMLVHGILHVFGYDHITKKQAAEMFPLQETLVSALCRT